LQRFVGTALGAAVGAILASYLGEGVLIVFHRFAEVSIGIAVALIFSVLWPEKEDIHMVQN